MREVSSGEPDYRAVIEELKKQKLSQLGDPLEEEIWDSDNAEAWRQCFRNEVRMQSLEKLGEIDRELHLSGISIRTLNPHRAYATSLHDLGVKLLSGDMHPGIIEAFGEGLCAIGRSHARNFPKNLFADFDYLASQILPAAKSDHKNPIGEINKVCDKIVSLLDLYGSQSEVRFQYVHDFLYGFDWAKWVGKAPPERMTVQPFDYEFLDYLYKRGREICQLIASDDNRFPKVSENKFRNSFGFMREPEQEVLLFRDLAKRGLLPVETWLIDARPVWDKPYHKIRMDRAKALGLELPRK